MTKRIRVRFAPSPTGALHIGGVRTALYNYLFAKKNGGTFILRIEDTDQTRYVPGAEDYIMEALEWCGLTPDESPATGGDYGPYRQSERKDLYRKYADQLVESENAYIAFDTPEGLDAKREAAEAEGNTFTYNASSRKEMDNGLVHSAEDVQKRIDAGEDYVIRFKMPEQEELSLQDIVRGGMSVQTAELDDKVLFKSDGMPTYHLANIVDDHLMEISHVIRGEEWLPSLPLHVLLYRSFGWDAPEFAHLPLILKPNPASYINKRSRQEFAGQFASAFVAGNSDYTDKQGKVLNFIDQLLQDMKSLTERLRIKDNESNMQKDIKTFLKSVLFGKLSKRDGDRLGIPVFPLAWEGDSPENSFTGFREFGFMPQAANNFLSFLGWNPGTEQEIFNIDELCEAFTLEKIGKSGARFDFDKAKWYNKQYIMATDKANLATMVRPLVEAAGLNPDQAYLENVCDLLKERVTFLTDFVGQAKPYLQDELTYDENAIGKKWKPELRPLFEKLNTTLKELTDYSADNIQSVVESFMEDNGLQMGDVFPLLRIALSGAMHGPGVFDMLAVIGQEKSIERMEKALQVFEG
jgi:glutamyl/glutaminyl-tRNA synthetase